MSRLSRSLEHELRDADVPLGEAALAVAEVEVPQPAEALVGEPLHRGAVRGQVPAPGGERPRVVRAVVLELAQAEVARLRRGAGQRRDRGDAAPREDVALDEVHLAPR